MKLSKPKFIDKMLFVEKIGTNYPEMFGFEHPFLMGKEYKGIIGKNEIAFLGNEQLFLDTVREAYKKAYNKDFLCEGMN
jgi:hypothetical protein